MSTLSSLLRTRFFQAGWWLRQALFLGQNECLVLFLLNILDNSAPVWVVLSCTCSYQHSTECSTGRIFRVLSETCSLQYPVLCTQLPWSPQIFHSTSQLKKTIRPCLGSLPCATLGKLSKNKLQGLSWWSNG